MSQQYFMLAIVIATFAFDLARRWLDGHWTRDA